MCGQLLSRNPQSEQGPVPRQLAVLDLAWRARFGFDSFTVKASKAGRSVAIPRKVLFIASPNGPELGQRLVSYAGKSGPCIEDLNLKQVPWTRNTTGRS